MGQLAKSLRRSGGLGDVKNSLKGIADMLEANRKKEEQKQFFKTVVSLYDKWKQGQERAEMKTDLKEGGQVANVLSPENITGITGKKPAGFNLDVNVPENIQSQLSSTPTIPETQTREIAPKERYDRGQENLNEFVNAIAPMILNPNIDDASLSRVNVLSGLAERQAGQLKPKDPTYFNLGQGQERYQQDSESGEIKKVAVNPKLDTSKIEEYERDEKGNYKVYEIQGQKYYNKIKRNAQGDQIGEQLTRIPIKGERNTTVNIKQPEEKSLKDSTAKLIADLKNFKPYTVNEEGQKIPMSPEDIKYGKDTTLENIKLQLLSPRGYEFITNIEQLWRKGDTSGETQYLSPKQLYDETVKHAELENIPEEVQDEIATYLRYYSEDIYKGLTTNATK